MGNSVYEGASACYLSLPAKRRVVLACRFEARRQRRRRTYATTLLAKLRAAAASELLRGNSPPPMQSFPPRNARNVFVCVAVCIRPGLLAYRPERVDTMHSIASRICWLGAHPPTGRQLVRAAHPPTAAAVCTIHEHCRHTCSCYALCRTCAHIHIHTDSSTFAVQTGK